MSVSRRDTLKGAGLLAATAVLPKPAIAQSKPLKIGLMAVKTGPLAAGGLHLEQGISSFLREREFKIAGRKVELIVADTGGSPVGAKTKASELVGGSTVADDTIVASFGPEASGLINSIPYALDYDHDANRRFIASMRRYFGPEVPIGFYAACLYANGQIVEAALQSLDGKSDDSAALIAAIKAVSLSETPRGPVSFDPYGNVVFDCYIRRVEKQNGRMANRTIKVYPKVSQFWNFEPEEFLKKPVFSRDYPPSSC